MEDRRADRLEEVLIILRKQGATLGAIAYCNELFGHPRIERLSPKERDDLTVVLREKMLEASMATNQSTSRQDATRNLQ